MSVIDSLAELMDELEDEPVDNERIYRYLNTTDTVALSAKIDAFKLIDAEVKPIHLKGKEAKTWTSDKNNRKGQAFEAVLNILLMPGGRCFSAWQRLQTDTNELDFLVGLEPLSGLIPMFRSWGNHFICECKSTEAFSAAWIDKLYAVLSTHNAHIGLVFSKMRPAKAGNASRAHATFVKIALLGKTIVPFDLKDAQSCISESNFLVILRARYTEVQTGIAELKRSPAFDGILQFRQRSRILRELD